MNKKNKSTIAVYAIIAILYLVAFVTIPFTKNIASWISFAFTLVSFVFGLGVTLYVFGKDDELLSKFYGIPIFKIAGFYTIAQVVFGIVICIVGSIVTVPYWIPLVISLALLGFAAIGVIVTDNVRDFIENTDLEIERKTEAVKVFNLNIASVIDLCTEDDVKKELESLAEDLRFSDPVSGEATEMLENELMEEIENMRLNISSQSVDENLKQIAKIKNLLRERNRVCKANKK